MTQKHCKHCDNGFFADEMECINGIMIDVDDFSEGFFAADVWRQPAPCHPLYCLYCTGTGDADGGDCEVCGGDGYTGYADYRERLLDVCEY